LVVAAAQSLGNYRLEEMSLELPPFTSKATADDSPNISHGPVFSSSNLSSQGTSGSTSYYSGIVLASLAVRTGDRKLQPTLLLGRRLTVGKGDKGVSRGEDNGGNGKSKGRTEGRSSGEGAGPGGKRGGRRLGNVALACRIRGPMGSSGSKIFYQTCLSHDVWVSGGGIADDEVEEVEDQLYGCVPHPGVPEMVLE